MTEVMRVHTDRLVSYPVRACAEIWKSRACGDGYRLLAEVFRIRRQFHSTRLRPRKYRHPGGTLVYRHDHRPVRTSY